MRSVNSLKNTSYAMLTQILSLIFKFIIQTIFIKMLGAEYLGVNGLFTNVLQMLSLAELGIGSAITYNLYKPLANNNEKEIKAYMNFYKKAYNFIGLFILIIGLCITPFLKFFIKNQSQVDNLNLIYLLFLLNTVLSYFFAYKRSIIIADQKSFLDSQNLLIKTIIQTILQVLILIFTKNYILFLVIQIACTFFSNIFISRKANKLYPYLIKNTECLTKKQKRKIYKDVYAMTAHRVGGVVVDGTDNLLISAFASLSSVGIYSNYVLIRSSIDQLLSQLFTAITASVGNLNAVSTFDKSYKVYQSIFFLNVWIYGFCSIVFLVCINQFITLWIGKEYLLAEGIVLLITINFFLTGIRKSTVMFKDTQGLFWNDRYKPYAEAIVNLIASIAFLKMFGFIGVLLGTLVSTITTCFWIEPYVLYKYGFKKPLSNYFKKFLIYTVIIVIIGFFIYYICDVITITGILGLVIKLLLCAVIFNGMYLLIFFKSPQFKYLLTVFNQLLLKKNIKILEKFCL